MADPEDGVHVQAKSLLRVIEEGENRNEMCADKLSAAQRARADRNRLRARVLRDARVVARAPHLSLAPPAGTTLGYKPVDTGGGFLLEEEEQWVAPAVSAPPAPLVHPAEQPACLECGVHFPQSILFDQFGHPVCDGCRDERGAHALVTRTEAKAEYLLKDCDLDLRPPALRCVRRRNPHSARYGDMRLYLAAQVQARALLVWGTEEALEAERARRSGARAAARAVRAGRELRALRLDVRSSLGARGRLQRDRHEHEYGPERHDAEADTYSRECVSCGHIQVYEKM